MRRWRSHDPRPVHLRRTRETSRSAIPNIFRSKRFVDMSLNQRMALPPPELVQAHLNLGRQTMAVLKKDKPIIVK
jgi:hypothetical protein